MRHKCRSAIFLSLFTPAVWAASALPTVHVYKSPTCGCCEKWLTGMKANGFEVVSHDTDNVLDHKKRLGVPLALAACHTAEVAGYFIEGHVPASDVKKLLAERPIARGLDVPGMPASAPGMDDNSKTPFAVLIVKKDGTTSTYNRY